MSVAHWLSKANIQHVIRFARARSLVLHLDEPALVVSYTVPTMSILLGLAISRDEVDESAEVSTAVLEILVCLVLEESLAG